ncbi:MAG: hypothetical protein ABJC51_09130 [Acidobacteriota bacterium]
MIWLFARGDEVLRLETRVDNASGEYVLVSTWSEGPAKVERFSDYETYDTRVRLLEARLDAEHWIQVGSPTILSDGWRGPIPN